ncbi:MAG: hypothetical protein UIM53_04970, partial [Acutalibacteraceae bacterium]|nr:hypothetical protein [Acutalibacteraceae bacterium]
MAVYWTIFIYTTVVSFLCSKTNSNKKDNNKYYSQQSVGMIGALLSFGVLIFFVGVRSYVADTSAYIYSFENSVDTLA